MAGLMQGCGTISSMESVSGACPLNRSQFDKLSVLDFKSTATAENAEAGKIFADKIADEIEKKNLFNKVVRGPVEGEALVICGEITRCDEGSAAARFWVGMGAGSSYFDADVQFKNNSEKSDLAAIKVDKNSWVLGGGLAASQTVEVFMSQAAKKIATELENSH
jgi:hypothetical protein